MWFILTSKPRLRYRREKKTKNKLTCIRVCEEEAKEGHSEERE